jgi:hypothetical protein
MKTVEIVPRKGTALSTTCTLGFSNTVLFIHRHVFCGWQGVGCGAFIAFVVTLLSAVFYATYHCYEFLLPSYEYDFTSHVACHGLPFSLLIYSSRVYFYC